MTTLRRTNASLTIATGWVLAPSWPSKARPARRRIPSTLKKSGVTNRCRAFGRCSGGTSGRLNRSTNVLLSHSCWNGRDEAAATSTAPALRSASSTASHQAFSRPAFTYRTSRETGCRRRVGRARRTRRRRSAVARSRAPRDGRHRRRASRKRQFRATKMRASARDCREPFIVRPPSFMSVATSDEASRMAGANRPTRR